MFWNLCCLRRTVGLSPFIGIAVSNADQRELKPAPTGLGGKRNALVKAYARIEIPFAELLIHLV